MALVAAQDVVLSSFKWLPNIDRSRKTANLQVNQVEVL